MQVIEEFMREQQTYIDAGLDKSNLLQSLPKMLASIANKREEITLAFEYTRDCDNIFQKLKNKM